MLKRFELFAGLGGGFGGAVSHGIFWFSTHEEAEHEAYLIACDEYESYGGNHGLDDMETVRQDLADSFYDGDYFAVPIDEAEDAYRELVESWIEYKAVELPSEITP